MMLLEEMNFSPRLLALQAYIFLTKNENQKFSKYFEIILIKLLVYKESIWFKMTSKLKK
jgi:hypothetical protein